MTDAQSPPPETPPPHHHEFETFGRGGVGNMMRSRSHSRDTGDGRSVSRDRIAKVWQKLTNQHPTQGHGIEEESVTSLNEAPPGNPE